MTEKDIRPIPKYILKLIERADNKAYPTYDGHVRFYAYLTEWKGELIKVSVAVKHYRRKWYCKQVAAHGIHSEKCYVKDMEYCGYVGMGYRVGWFEQGLQDCRKWFEYKDWGYAEDRYYDPWGILVNPNFIDRFPEYKYSAWQLFKGANIVGYLRLYEKFPQIEYLMKLGLDTIATSITILRRTGKDKAFCKWLIMHREELSEPKYDIAVIIRAYKTGNSLQAEQECESLKKRLIHETELKPIRELFKGDYGQLFSYLRAQKTNPNTYLDYLNACIYLNLDMSQPKNRYPHDFKRWHDIRIDEYHTSKAFADEKERREMYRQFAQIADKYLPLQYDKRSAYIVIIPKSPADLIHEGEALQHCVGRMNYDQRFIREESLIFFIRSKSMPETPLVTVEYSLSSHKVLQCYGERDSTPSPEIQAYVNKIWLPYANRQIKKLQIAA